MCKAWNNAMEHSKEVGRKEGRKETTYKFAKKLILYGETDEKILSLCEDITFVELEKIRIELAK